LRDKKNSKTLTKHYRKQEKWKISATISGKKKLLIRMGLLLKVVRPTPSTHLLIEP